MNNPSIVETIRKGEKDSPVKQLNEWVNKLQAKPKKQQEQNENNTAEALVGGVKFLFLFVCASREFQDTTGCFKLRQLSSVDIFIEYFS